MGAGHQPSISNKYVPDTAEKQKCFEFGKEFARIING